MWKSKLLQRIYFPTSPLPLFMYLRLMYGYPNQGCSRQQLENWNWKWKGKFWITTWKSINLFRENYNLWFFGFRVWCGIFRGILLSNFNRHFDGAFRELFREFSLFCSVQKSQKDQKPSILEPQWFITTFPNHYHYHNSSNLKFHKA